MTKWLVPLEIALFTLVNLIHIWTCPFSKVEESFNTQATYDVINSSPLFPTDTSKWDHVDFPGVVPRTFIGALTIGSIVRMFMSIFSPSPTSQSQLYLQITSRIILACFMTFSLCFLTRAIQRRFQLKTRILFDLLMVTQFHYMFYGSRFLPNTFAAILTNLIIASWLDSRDLILIPCVATSVIVFRFDSLIFFGWIVLVGLILTKNISFWRLLTIGLPSGIIALAASITIDSYLWGRLLWPEGEGIYFNLWLNKSHEWGTQPYLWYFYSCLPKLALTGLFYIPFASRFSIHNLLLPTLAFIATYSILPHKELRFIIYIVPVLNIIAADGLSNFVWLLANYRYLTSKIVNIKENKKQNPIYLLFTLIELFSKAGYGSNETKRTVTKLKPPNKYRGVFFVLVIFFTLAINTICTIIFLTASSFNYPGGHSSLWLLKNTEIMKVGESSTSNYKISVYAGNLAAQTGLSRFLQVKNIRYYKDALLNADEILSNDYSTAFLILEPDEVSRFETDFCEGKKLSYNLEVECKHKIEKQRHCCIVHTEMIFDNVTIDLRKMIDLTMKLSIRAGDLIRTKEALKIVRCGLSSKFTPFL